MYISVPEHVTGHTPDVENELRGKQQQTFQFLAQIARSVSQDINASARAAGFNLVLSVYVFFSSKIWCSLTALYD